MNAVLAASNRFRAAMAFAAMCLALAACEQLPGATSAGGPADAGDIVAPSVFQKTDQALWDGRPSLGGTWVAHEDAVDPEKVTIRNDVTGKTVQAALFRKELGQPGTPFQLSADAAVALGINAGAPTPITVTALRRKEVPKPAPAPAPETAPATDAIAAADAAIDEALDPTVAAVPVEEKASSGSRPGSFGGSAPQNTGVNAPAAATATVAAAAVATDAAAAPVAEAEPAARPGSFFGSKPKPATAPDSDAPIPLQGSTLDGITASTLATAPTVPAPAATPEQALEAATLAPPSAPASTAPSASSLERPYVQVASGSTRANSDALVAKLMQSELKAQVRETSVDNKPLYYVVVGPAATEAELQDNLARVRALGYAEAFIAKG